MLTEVVQILGVLLVGTLVVLRVRTKRRDRRAAGGNVPKKRSTGWPASGGGAPGVMPDGGSPDGGGSSDSGGGSSCGGGGGCGGGG